MQSLKLKEWIKKSIKKDKSKVMVDNITIDEGGLTED